MESKDHGVRESPINRVSVIGTGAIGTAVVRVLVKAGREVTVWNRTPDRAAEAVRVGATLAGSAQDAVEASQLTLLTLTDYDAVMAVLNELIDASGRILVVLSTGSPDQAQSAAERAQALRAAYVDAGVQTDPDGIGTPTATILYSGSPAAYERVRATVALLSTPRYVGSSPTAAAVWDLALFGVWYDAQIGLLRALETLRNGGIDMAEFSSPAQTQLGHVVDAVPQTAEEVLTASYPRGPADLAEHLPVIDQLIDLRRSGVLGNGGLDEVRQIAARLVEQGHGRHGLSALLATDL